MKRCVTEAAGEGGYALCDENGRTYYSKEMLVPFSVAWSVYLKLSRALFGVQADLQAIERGDVRAALPVLAQLAPKKKTRRRRKQS